jgi:uncharacterized protein YigE (DUF2233 family)
MAIAAAWAFGLTVRAEPLPLSNRPPASCWEQSFEGDAFIVCRYRPETDELRLVWAGRNGKPLGSLPALKAHLGKDSRRVLFAMNAGMYDPARRPVGLFVQDTRLVQPLNRKDGRGNFFMKPNGVFWVEAAGLAHLDETDTYAHDPGLPMWATQSGPMLVTAREVNPRIMPNGASRYVRNAVGVTYTGAFFVISRRPISLGRLARFMRDELSCLDALYLDGAVSSLWSPDLGRLDRRTGLGPMVVVLARP